MGEGCVLDPLCLRVPSLTRTLIRFLESTRKDLRMRIVRLISICLLLASLLPAQQSKPSNPAGLTLPADLPNIPLFDLSAMDKSAEPCVDFYKYACGGWMAKNPIPPDQSLWGRFSQLQERNRDVLHAILAFAAKPDPKRSPVMQKIGDFYASCMDEQKANAQGAKPLQPEFDRINKIASRQDLVKTIAHLQSIGVTALFRFGPEADMHNSTMQIAGVYQGGLSLPDRDYYLKDDAKSVETRQKYVEHVGRMFELLGDNPQTASVEARTVMSIETMLA